MPSAITIDDSDVLLAIDLHPAKSYCTALLHRRYWFEETAQSGHSEPLIDRARPVAVEQRAGTRVALAGRRGRWSCATPPHGCERRRRPPDCDPTAIRGPRHATSVRRAAFASLG